MILEEFLPLGAQVTFSVSTKGFKVHTKTKTVGCAIVCVESISNLFRTPYERNGLGHRLILVLAQAVLSPFSQSDSMVFQVVIVSVHCQLRL